MTIWGHACCWWYGVQARWEGLHHLLRGHDLRWRDCPELWTGITGCINCYNCPDTSDGKSDLAIWIREWRMLSLAAQLLCGWLGHTQATQWLDGKTGEPTDHWSCYRCVADMEAP